MSFTASAFLATTALDSFWDKTKPILFLNEWCQLHTQKDTAEALDCQFLPAQELEKLYSESAFQYTLNLYETLLPLMAAWLNQIHGVDNSLKYWRITLGPFLQWYIQVVYQRYHNLKLAYDSYAHLTTIGLAKSSYLTPINTQEFCLFAAESDGWNLQLVTQLLDLAFKKPTLYKPYDWQHELSQRYSIFGQYEPYKAKTKAKIMVMRWLAKLRGTKVVALCDCVHEFSKNNLYRLMFLSKFRILPFAQLRFPENAAITQLNLDLAKRSQLTSLPIKHEFLSLILETLKVNLPINFLENYHDEVTKSDKSFPYPADVIVGAGWLQNDRLKMWGAKKAENQAKLVNLQHGGGYGALQFCAYETLERQNCDAYITWGWQEEGNVIPAPSILVCERTEERRKKLAQYSADKQGILWVVTEVDRYPAFTASYLNYMREPYFNAQERFVKALSPDLLQNMTLRVRPNSRYVNYWRERLPNVNINLPTDKSSYFDELCKIKILVSDNCNTTYLYSLLFNIPTILFWDKKLWPLRESAEPYYASLQQAGIYHETPESAALMLKNIAENPLDWWHSEVVQQARINFCQKYAQFSNAWLQHWSNMLLSIK